MKPSLGRIVHFVSQHGEEYSAIITRVWTDVCVNLFVFPRGDFEDNHTGIVTSVVFGNQNFSWHWPERVE